MGVIQSSINQAAQIGAAIYTQTPKYQKKVAEAQKVKESEAAADIGKKAAEAAKAPNLSKEQSEYGQKVSQESYAKAFGLNPTLETLQNLVFNTPSEAIKSAVNERANRAAKFNDTQLYELYNKFGISDPTKISKVENPRSWYTVNYPGDKHIKGGK